MTGSIRKVAFLAVCGLLSASAAMAGVPSAGTSVIGSFIRLGGFDNSNVVEPQVNKIITVNDAGGSPVQNSTVELRFGACSSGGGGDEIRICGDQPHAGVGVSCVDRTIIAVTDASGNATFRIVGHATNPGGGVPGAPAAGESGACVEVRADGVVLGNLRVATYDQNGVNGVNPVDLALFLNDRFTSDPSNPPCTAVPFTSPCYRGRSDYDGNGLINPVDLALFLSVRFAGLSPNSCVGASVCAP